MEYEKRLDLVRSTGLKILHSKTPAHFKAWVEAEEEDTPAKAFGRATHCAILEPERFAKAYVVEPAFGDCRAKANKEARDAWRAEHMDCIPLTADELSRILRMRIALCSHPFLAKVLDGAEFEAIITVRTGDLEERATFDLLNRRLGVGVDLKSTDDASPRGVEKAIGNFGYALQDVHYRHVAKEAGIDLKSFLFAFVEKEAPHCVGQPGPLDEDSLTWAAQRRDQLVQLQAECLAAGQWPGYDTKLRTYSVPVWARS